MNSDIDYDDYSAVDAVNHLITVLEQFFKNQRNQYKFSLAKKHFDTLNEKGTPADAAKLFKILTGTDLVTKKHVLHYRTTTGMRYRIKKEYRQSEQRDIRTQRRANRMIDTTTPISKASSSPFIQMMDQSTLLDDSSDDDTTNPEVNRPHIDTTKDPDSPNNEPPNTTDALSVHSDLTKHADDLEKNMDNALQALQQESDPQNVTPSEDHDKMTGIIEKIIQREMHNVMEQVRKTEEELLQRTKQCDELHRTLQHTIAEAKQHHSSFVVTCDKMYSKINYINRTLDEYELRIEKFTNLTTDITKTISTEVEKCVEPQ